MKEYYIKGTNKKHSVREDGVVFTHYSLNKKRQPIYKTVKTAIQLNSKTSKSSCVSILIDGKFKTVFMVTIMELYFKIKPPDSSHRYSCYYIDGNIFNNSIKNIGYKILTEGNCNFQPIAFHKKRKVIAKICCNCGEKKDIKYFNLQRSSLTYRNSCESCRSKKQWDYIKSDSERHLKVVLRTKAWAKSKEGQVYYKNYLHEAGIKYRNNFQKCYLDQIIKHRGMSPESFTEEMRESLKIILKIKREIKLN